MAGEQQQGLDRRERLRKLALETIDLAKDPYILRNHVGSIECRLCLTLHTNEGSYLAHTQGKKHQANLGRRAAREAKDSSLFQGQALAQAEAQRNAVPVKSFVRIGAPGYSVTKVRDPVTQQLGLLVQVHLPHIKKNVRPIYRIMSSYEQHVEQPNQDYQYIVVAAEPYASIAFRIQARSLDETEGTRFDHWDGDSATYSFQFLFQ